MRGVMAGYEKKVIGVGILSAALAAVAVAFAFWASGQGPCRTDGWAADTAPVDFSQVVERVMPSLVKVENEGVTGHPGFGGKDERIEIAQTSEGTGFFIDDSGLILTNYHVVQGAQAITVLTTERKSYAAELVGADVISDVALIRIRPDFKVRPVRLGDSGKLKIGQWVIAMGNPLGLDFFTSAGIVSGFGPPGPDYYGFYDFIQADLNIEPGNSGGPLLNYAGEVVGINNAYLGPGTKIGFAIPINRVKEIVDQLLEKGSISRGFLGTLGQSLTPGLAERLGLKGTQGAMVVKVLPGSPADEGGLMERDVVLEFNGLPVRNDRELQEKVYTSPAGREADLLVVRDGRRMHLKVTLSELKEHSLVSQKAVLQCGISFVNVPEKLARRLRLGESGRLMVVRVIPGCPAFEGGLRFGDVVQEVEGKKVYNEAEFYSAYMQAKPGRPVLLLVIRDGRPLYLTIKQGEPKV